MRPGRCGPLQGRCPRRGRMFIAIADNGPGAPAGRDVLRDPGKPEGCLSLRPLIVVFDSKLAVSVLAIVLLDDQTIAPRWGAPLPFCSCNYKHLPPTGAPTGTGPLSGDGRWGAANPGEPKNGYPGLICAVPSGQPEVGFPGDFFALTSSTLGFPSTRLFRHPHFACARRDRRHYHPPAIWRRVSPRAWIGICR
jgi:hypothetical protein